MVISSPRSGVADLLAALAVSLLLRRRHRLSILVQLEIVEFHRPRRLAPSDARAQLHVLDTGDLVDQLRFGGASRQSCTSLSST